MSDNSRYTKNIKQSVKEALKVHDFFIVIANTTFLEQSEFSVLQLTINFYYAEKLIAEYIIDWIKENQQYIVFFRRSLA